MRQFRAVTPCFLDCSLFWRRVKPYVSLMSSHTAFINFNRQTISSVNPFVTCCSILFSMSPTLDFQQVHASPLYLIVFCKLRTYWLRTMLFNCTNTSYLTFPSWVLSKIFLTSDHLKMFSHCTLDFSSWFCLIVSVLFSGITFLSVPLATLPLGWQLEFETALASHQFSHSVEAERLLALCHVALVSREISIAEFAFINQRCICSR